MKPTRWAGVPQKNDALHDAVYFIEGWLGMVAPINIPTESLTWLTKSIGELMRSAEIKEKVEELGMVVSNLDAEKSKEFMC
jgi:tripartite-type tricarboxylate transporter receptor subunit TctC